MTNEIQAELASSSSNLSTLDRRRLTIYSLLLIFQTLSLISNTILLPASQESNTALSFRNAVLIDLVITLSLHLTIITFLYYFIKKRIHFWGLILLLIISILLNSVARIMHLHELNFETFRLIYGITSSISLSILSFTFFVAVRDIFGKNLKIGAALLGAANIYLLIGSGFAFIYTFLNVLMPGSMVPIQEMGNLFNTCAINSAYILGGMDLPNNDFIPAIKHIMMFESIFAHLFAVFIVGRLLAK